MPGYLAARSMAVDETNAWQNKCRHRMSLSAGWDSGDGQPHHAKHLVQVLQMEQFRLHLRLLVLWKRVLASESSYIALSIRIISDQ